MNSEEILIFIENIEGNLEELKKYVYRKAKYGDSFDDYFDKKEYERSAEAIKDSAEDFIKLLNKEEMSNSSFSHDINGKNIVEETRNKLLKLKEYLDRNGVKTFRISDYSDNTNVLSLGTEIASVAACYGSNKASLSFEIIIDDERGGKVVESYKVPFNKPEDILEILAMKRPTRTNEIPEKFSEYRG